MTLAHWCILIAILLPYAFTVTAKLKGRFRPKDNRNPREFLEKLEGTAKRAHWAQLNTFESIPGFIAGVLVAQQVQAPQARIDALAVAYLVLRLGYGLAYIGDTPRLRSLLWFAALACVVGLFVIGA